MFSWNDPVNKLRLVSPSAEGALLSLGIKTIRDLVYHYPRQWQDLSDVLPISSALPRRKPECTRRNKKTIRAPHQMATDASH